MPHQGMESKPDFKCLPEFQEYGLFLDHGSIGDLDNAQELVLIRTPWKFDIEKLNGQEICLAGRQEYESTDDIAVIVNSSRSSKDLQNICTLKKDASGKGCSAVTLHFKRQVDICESYAFPDPIMPGCVEKHVPSPQGLKERLTPYGSDEPVVFSKKRKEPRKGKTKCSDFSESCEDENLSSSQSKKKKKRKMKNENITQNSSVQSPVSRKSRKISIKSEIFDSDHTEQSTQSPKKKKKVKSEFPGSYVSDWREQVQDESSPDHHDTESKSKHKKKKEIKKSLSPPNVEEFDADDLHERILEQKRIKKESKMKLQRLIKMEPESCGSD